MSTRTLLIAVVVLTLTLATTGLALAQEPATPPRGGTPPAGTMHPHMGGMMGGAAGPCPMLGDGMMGGMMGGMMPMMGAGAPADPKVAGRLMQMRGEMMKAVGDIMVRYGKAMETGQ